MDLYSKNPAVTKAMALALMRQAHALLLAAQEVDAAAHLQRALDDLVRGQPKAPAETP